MMGSTKGRNGTEPMRTAGPKTSVIRSNCDTPLAVSSWSWHAPYYAGAWSLLDLPAAAKSSGIQAIECNDFMMPPPRLSRIRRPLLALLPGCPPELWRYSRATLSQLGERNGMQGTNVLAWTLKSDFTVAAHKWPAQRLYLSRGLLAARQMQAPLLRVTLGGSPQTVTTADARIIRRLADFVIRSQRRYPGVTITVENHWGVSSD